MALTQTREQVRDNVRRAADIRGTNALARHPDADLNEYINRGYAALYRKLTVVLPDQRFLASDVITTEAGETLYDLPADFDHLISVDMLADGVRVWLTSHEMNERPSLISPDTVGLGRPLTYRLRASNIELLPTPSAAYSVTLWYVPTTDQFAEDGDVFDTISRLDDYVISYAVKAVAVQNKDWPLVTECRQQMAELDPELEAIARSRDKNSPARIVDEMAGMRVTRWGRRRLRAR